MQKFLFQIKRSKTVSLQSQIREVLVSAILAGHLPARGRIPSTREMAKTLGVSRNTVLLCYLALVDDGYLLPRDRSGYYVNEAMVTGRVASPLTELPGKSRGDRWQKKFRVRPARQKNIVKPAGWQNYDYPFVYGQIDSKLFPMADWRECQRQALGKKWFDVWTQDTRGNDDEMLIEQIRTRLLPRRGILAAPDEILVTMGAQNALYILASLLVTSRSRVGFEDPGYLDARNIFNLKTDHIRSLPVDRHGLIVDDRLKDCDLVYVTPSHQFPTTVTLSRDRRAALIESAEKNDIILIEDDYEAEANFMEEPTPALKSLDTGNNVLYVGSLSKSLFPGLRIGFLVAPREVIDEARALRLLMIRHPPSNNQRATAQFLALGHHDALLQRLSRKYLGRWREMGDALDKHLPNSSQMPSFGGSSYWVRGVAELDADALATEALKKGVILEPGRVFYSGENPPVNYFRLGFSSIERNRIEPGIKIISSLIDEQLGG